MACKRCGSKFDLKKATKDMKKFDLCWHCILEYKRKFKDMSLKKFAETERESSYFEI